MVQENIGTPYRLWAGDETVTTGLVCLFQPKCQFCETNMQVWTIKPQNFEINDGTGHKNAHAMDIEMWCPTCGYTEMFGVPISKEHYEFVQRRLKFLPNKKYFQNKVKRIEVKR